MVADDSRTRTIFSYDGRVNIRHCNYVIDTTTIPMVRCDPPIVNKTVPIAKNSVTVFCLFVHVYYLVTQIKQNNIYSQTNTPMDIDFFVNFL